MATKKGPKRKTVESIRKAALEERTFHASEIPDQMRQHARIVGADDDVFIDFDTSVLEFASQNPEVLRLKLKTRTQAFSPEFRNELFETLPPAFARMAMAYIADLSTTAQIHEARR